MPSKCRGRIANCSGFRFQERIVCVVTEDYVMKTADVPYSAVADFLDLVFGEMDEEEWNDLEVYDDE